jgi:diguanylate cyclase
VSEIDRARKVAAEALQAMNQRAIAPAPPHYAVWFGHFSGDNPALSRAIDEFERSGTRISDRQSDMLFQRFCGSGMEEKQLIENSSKLDSILTRLIADMGGAGEEQQRFATALEGFVKTGGKDVVETLAREALRMAERSRKLETALKASGAEIGQMRSEMDEVRRLALTDPLTGLANRKLCEDRLREALRVALEQGTPVSLIVMDLDHFRKFNEAHGAQLGDEVLRLVAKTLREGVKGQDTVARHGGEEFAVVLPETAVKHAVTLAENLRERVGQKQIFIRSTGKVLGTVTLSFGVAGFQRGETASELFARAELALQLAKRSGRNRVCGESDLPRKPAEPVAARA